jgi:hypothetical protein
MNEHNAEPALPALPEPDGNLEIQVDGRWVWVGRLPREHAT